MASFLSERRTQLAFPGYSGGWRRISIGIPQGSPLSPILFLFFISELLEHFQQVNQDTLGFGFVDDTNLVAWGDSAADNCRRLTAAHDRCIAWAKRHGARFSPEKYALMHFTRRRRDPDGDLASTVTVGGRGVEVEKTKLRVLGVWVDPRMSWQAHASVAAEKGEAGSCLRGSGEG